MTREVARRRGERVYDSHAARRRLPLAWWYPEHLIEIRFCRIADAVTHVGE